MSKQITSYVLLGLTLVLACGFSQLSGADDEVSIENPLTETLNEDNAQAPTYFIRELRVEGNTLLDKADIERIVYPYLGPDKTLQDLQTAADALRERYHHDGYKLADVHTRSV